MWMKITMPFELVVSFCIRLDNYCHISLAVVVSITEISSIR